MPQTFLKKISFPALLYKTLCLMVFRPIPVFLGQEVSDPTGVFIELLCKKIGIYFENLQTNIEVPRKTANPVARQIQAFHCDWKLGRKLLELIHC